MVEFASPIYSVRVASFLPDNFVDIPFIVHGNAHVPVQKLYLNNGSLIARQQ